MKILALILFITAICNRIAEARYILKNPWATQEMTVANEGNPNDAVLGDGNNVLHLQRTPSSNYQQVNVNLNAGDGTVTTDGFEGTIPRQGNRDIDPYNGNKVTLNVGSPGGSARTFFTSLGNVNTLPYNGNRISVKTNPPDAGKRSFILKGDNETTGPTEDSNGKKISHLSPQKKSKSANTIVNHGTVSNGHDNTTGDNRKKIKSHHLRHRKTQSGNKNVKHRTVRKGPKPSESD